MRGRRPKPVELKVLQGNPGHRPLDLARHPAPARGAPSCPAFLDVAAKAEWRRISGELAKLGLLTRLDRGALTAACSAWGAFATTEAQLRHLEAEHAAAEAELDQVPEPPAIDGAPDPAAAQRKRLSARVNKLWGRICVLTGKRRHALKEYKTYLGELGLSPAARSGIKVSDGQAELPLGQPESAFDRAARLSAG